MTTTTIQITPRAFGNIAAAAMSHGCDVTTYLVRAALSRDSRRVPAPATSMGLFDGVDEDEEPAPAQPAPQQP